MPEKERLNKRSEHGESVDCAAASLPNNHRPNWPGSDSWSLSTRPDLPVALSGTADTFGEEKHAPPLNEMLIDQFVTGELAGAESLGIAWMAMRFKSWNDSVRQAIEWHLCNVSRSFGEKALDEELSWLNKVTAESDAAEFQFHGRGLPGYLRDTGCKEIIAYILDNKSLEESTASLLMDAGELREERIEWLSLALRGASDTFVINRDAPPVDESLLYMYVKGHLSGGMSLYVALHSLRYESWSMALRREINESLGDSFGGM